EAVSLSLYPALRPGRQLVAAERGPALDHLARHVDVALEADVPAERKRLLVIESIGQHARGALRQSESVVMPLESQEPVAMTEPRIRRGIDHVDLAPADFRCRAAHDLGPQRLREQLAA